MDQIGMRVELRMVKRRKRGEKASGKRREKRCGRVLSYYTKSLACGLPCGTREKVAVRSGGGGGRSARGDWRGGVAEVDEARYG